MIELKLDQKQYLSNIKRLIKIHDMEQQELAEIIGLKPQTLNAKLRGERLFKPEEIAKILVYFQKTFEEIFLDSNDT